MQVRITTAVTRGEVKQSRCIYQDVENDQDITELLWAVRQYLRSQLKKDTGKPLVDNLGVELNGDAAELETINE